MIKKKHKSPTKNDWCPSLTKNNDKNHEVSQPHFGQVWRRSPTLGKVGDLESSGTPECSELDSKRKNTSHWSVLGVIGKVLKRKYRKWPRIGHLDICSPSYGQKKGWESNWQFDSRPLKVGNRPLPNIRFECATWRWKDLDEGYNFGSQSDSAVGSYGRSKFRESRRDNFGTPFWESREFVPFGCSLHGELREYYMGEGGGFPRVRAVVSLVCPSARGLSQHPRVSRMLN
jgi:hypothetical protein